MSILVKIRCTGEKLNFIRKPLLASGDLSAVRVKFTFDSAWNGYIKTAVFTKNDEPPQYKLIEDDECYIPPEILSRKCRFYIGVIGDKSGKRITSRLLAYDIGQGATDGNYPVPPPSGDIYHQLLEKLDEIAASGGSDPEALKEAIKVYCDEQNFASKEYVDSKEFNCDCDSKGYITQDELDDALANIKPDCECDPTKIQAAVDNYCEEKDLASKQYVEDSISASIIEMGKEEEMNIILNGSDVDPETTEDNIEFINLIFNGGTPTGF